MAENRLNKSEQGVQAAILKEEYEEARKQMVSKRNNIRPVYRAIFEASLAFAEGDYPQAWEKIAEGLKADGKSYELYVMLGDYYASQHLWQAYLCYENALFHCNDDEDSKEICRMLENLSNEGVHVPKAAIVIISYNLLDMTRGCIESIRKTTFADSREIIVVDNASVDGSVEWLKKQRDIKLLCNSENRGFPAACNQGIGLAESDSDIFLLNNDTVMTDNALFWLRMGLYEKEKVGSTGCVSNYVSNMQAVVENGKSEQFYLDFAKKTNVPSENPYLAKVYLVGYALLIKRTVLNKTGVLDERFSPGNYEDNDICLRIGLAGYSNVLCRNSFIIHWGSQSFGREPQKYDNLLATNERKFFEKWAAFRIEPGDYWGGQSGLLSLYEQYCTAPRGNIMVVGTGAGGFLSVLRDRYPDVQIYGMEKNSFLAQISDGIADTVCIDYDKWKGDELSESFDTIFMMERIECINNPESVLKELAKMLKEDGHLLFGYENRNHYLRMLNPDSNIRMYDHRQGIEMLRDAKLCLNTLMFNQIEDQSKELEDILCSLQEKHSEITKEDLLVYQWIIIADKQRTDIQFGNKIAVCIPTYERPKAVEDVLFHCAETYKRCGVDVYYYDSSEDDSTRKVIESYQNAGYDNLYYIRITPGTNFGLKFEHVVMMHGTKKEYEYMWYSKDRCWCEEKTLKLIYKAMKECHDLIFLDVGHPDSEREIAICNDANEFYHRCGDYATSMDTTIYNVKTMLRDDFGMEEFRKIHDKHDGFMHFIIIFEQLAKKKKPDICLLSGRNVTIFNSRNVRSGWHERRIQTWGKVWVEVNEALPDCYTEKDVVIKRTASLPWLLGDINALVDLHNKGILTPEYYDEIKVFWERVSDIPLDILRLIAYGKYIPS